MLSLVGSVVNEANVQPPPQGICWDILYKVARENCFSAMLYPVLKDNPKLPQPVLNDFLRDYQLYVAKDLTQQFELQKMLDFCEREAIANLPLKGCVLKRLYPQSYMRFMGDIDLWTDASGVKKLRDFLVQSGYNPVSRTGIHDEYEKPPHMAVEVHKKLVIDENRAASFFNVEIPQRLIRTDGRKYSYAMMPQDFYLHLLDHTAKHFYGTGITPRMILDFYMLEKSRLYRTTGNWRYCLKGCIFKPLRSALQCLRTTGFHRTERVLQRIRFRCTLFKMAVLAGDAMRMLQKRQEKQRKKSRRLKRVMCCAGYFQAIPCSRENSPYWKRHLRLRPLCIFPGGLHGLTLYLYTGG